MWMTDQECHTSVQGGGGGPNPFLVALLQTLACYVGGHTHTPESIATRSIALHVLLFTSLEKCQNKKNHAKIALN